MEIFHSFPWSRSHIGFFVVVVLGDKSIIENSTELVQFWGKSMPAVVFLAHLNLTSSFSDLSLSTSPHVPQLQPPFTTALHRILHASHLPIYLSIIYLSSLYICIFVHAITNSCNTQSFIKLCTGLRDLLTLFKS